MVQIESRKELSFVEKADRSLRRQVTSLMDESGILSSSFNIKQHMRPSYGCNFTENNFRSQGPDYKEKFKGKVKMDRDEYHNKHATRIDLLR